MKLLAIHSVTLTGNIRVNSGSHILYFYDHVEKYLENAISFIITGLEQGEYIIFIDNQLNTQEIKSRLERIISASDLEKVNFVNNYEFYLLNTFDFNRVFRNFVSAVQPYLENKLPVRTWGHVEWSDQEDFLDKLHNYENQCDMAVNQLGVLTVCAYSGQLASASIQIRMMKSHEYLMTDDELTRSSLYNNQAGNNLNFPSLAEHSKIMDEIDLYKQKLDFVHVVSHEVRNPLTVINAYASMILKDQTVSDDSKKKLIDIQDYVKVIDNEITHIINTEQMLTSEALWRKSAVSPLSIAQEVIDIMATKGRTQGIELHSSIQLTGNEIINSNVIGFRLIISNLLSNAIKYSQEGNCVFFKVWIKHNQLHLEIKDNGVGISNEQRQMLFEKYQKMNTEKSGQGIGLFMVKRLVDHFEGEIDLTSELGKGTIVTIKIPLFC